ncbi:hypothetical protein [Ruegeria arenilitoris]|uniref:hypothetical protein n=1 Tax=Ruegeria arenilitoris TaxID=1173585 RepID=UPI001C2BF480|nr:hypothetical protein [Ruegeria arenilitoris]
MKTGQRCAQTDNKEPFDKGLHIKVEKPELPTLQADQTTIKGGKQQFAANNIDSCNSKEADADIQMMAQRYLIARHLKH